MQQQTRAIQQCRLHQEECIAINMNPMCESQERHCCIKCLDNPTKLKDSLSYTDAYKYMYQLKKTYKSQKEEQNLKNVNVLMELIKLTQNMKKQSDEAFDSLIKDFNNYIVLFENESSIIDQKISDLDLDDYFQQKIEFISEKIDIQEFQKQINEYSSTMLKNVKYLSQKLGDIDESTIPPQFQVPLKDGVKSKKKPRLSFLCTEHDEEMRMYDQDESVSQEDRLICDECIIDRKGPFTPISILYKLWEEDKITKTNLMNQQQTIFVSNVKVAQDQINEIYVDIIIDLQQILKIILQQKQEYLSQTEIKINLLKKDWSSLSKDEVLKIAENLLIYKGQVSSLNQQENENEEFIKKVFDFLNKINECRKHWAKISQKQSNIQNLTIHQIILIEFKLQKQSKINTEFENLFNILALYNENIQVEQYVQILNKFSEDTWIFVKQNKIQYSIVDFLMNKQEENQLNIRKIIPILRKIIHQNTVVQQYNDYTQLFHLLLNCLDDDQIQRLLLDNQNKIVSLDIYIYSLELLYKIFASNISSDEQKQLKVYFSKVIPFPPQYCIYFLLELLADQIDFNQIKIIYEIVYYWQYQENNKVQYLAEQFYGKDAQLYEKAFSKIQYFENPLLTASYLEQLKKSDIYPRNLDISLEEFNISQIMQQDQLEQSIKDWIVNLKDAQSFKNLIPFFFNVIKKGESSENFLSMINQYVKAELTTQYGQFNQKSIFQILYNNANDELKVVILKKMSENFPIPLLFRIPFNAKTGEIEKLTFNINTFYVFQVNYSIINISFDINQKRIGKTQLINKIFYQQDKFEIQDSNKLNKQTIDVMYDFQFSGQRNLSVADTHGFIPFEILDDILPIFKLWIVQVDGEKEIDNTIQALNQLKSFQNKDKTVCFLIRNATFDQNQLHLFKQLEQLNIQYKQVIDLSVNDLNRQMIDDQIKQVSKFLFDIIDQNSKTNQLNQEEYLNLICKMKYQNQDQTVEIKESYQLFQEIIKNSLNSMTQNNEEGMKQQFCFILIQRIMQQIEVKLNSLNIQFSNFCQIKNSLGERCHLSFAFFTIWRMVCCGLSKSSELKNYIDKQFIQFKVEMQQEESRIMGQTLAQEILAEAITRLYMEYSKEAKRIIANYNQETSFDLINKLDKDILEKEDKNIQGEQIFEYIRNQSHFIEKYMNQKINNIKEEIQSKFTQKLKTDLKAHLQKVDANTSNLHNLIKQPILALDYFVELENQDLAPLLLYKIVFNCLQGQVSQSFLDMIKFDKRDAFQTEGFQQFSIPLCSSQSDANIKILFDFVSEFRLKIKDLINNASQLDIDIQKLNIQSELDSLKRKQIGCLKCCPVCKRKCDQEIDDTTHKHQCKNGHQLRGMIGVLKESHPSLITCEEIQDDFYIRELGTGAIKQWKEIQKNFNTWTFTCQTTDKLKLLKDKFMKIWNQNIGQMICEQLSQELGQVILYGPKLEAEQKNIHYVLMLDDSGSMEGNPFNQAKTGLIAVLQEIKKNPDSRVTIIIFNHDARCVVDNQPSNPEVQQNLITFNCGGTNFDRAFNLAYDKIAQNPDFNKFASHSIFFYTDGSASYPAVAMDKFKQLQQEKRQKIELIACSEDEKPSVLIKVAEFFKQFFSGAELKSHMQPQQIGQIWIEEIVIELLKEKNKQSDYPYQNFFGIRFQPYSQFV